MWEYRFSEIRPDDRAAVAELDALLARNGIRRDAHLDYIVGLYDDERGEADEKLVATGACFANTLRCFAVDDAHQGEGLMNRVVSHLVSRQIAHGNAHLFLYTKPDTARFFHDLGFYKIADTHDVVFMENKRDGFSSFLEALAEERRDGTSAALVMNCNPFTLGHLHLVERAAGENDNVHLFVVSEDASFFPFEDRFRLVAAGTAHLTNVSLHPSSSYMISQAVFPSYFLEEGESVIRAQASLDVSLFARIAHAIGVTKRYVGDEPFSRVTGIYNDIMKERLPRAGVECVVVPRFELDGVPVSASHVRQLIHDGRVEEARHLVPATTFDYFSTEEGRRVVRRIEEAGRVKHY
ncbi:[citrate (pro-3S)-lyase] ligase [Synergistaceae bacterium OttesenSCG-928-I11]|nr:[citrate (pro-3S)-lyase] ligase [Synergistaceae bacterium OttesenSCG-928-I11]